MLKICVIDWQSYPSLCDAPFSVNSMIRHYADSTQNAWSVTMWCARQHVSMHEVQNHDKRRMGREEWKWAGDRESEKFAIIYRDTMNIKQSEVLITVAFHIIH